MNRILVFLSMALCCLSAHGAAFPYITLNKQTNRVSDNGTALTFNGTPIGGGGGDTNWVASGTNSTHAGQVTIGSLLTMTAPTGSYVPFAKIPSTDTNDTFNFNFGMASFDNTPGGRKDTAVSYGWNLKPSGVEVSGQMAAGLIIENYYHPTTNSPAQNEIYFAVFDTNGATQYRPWGAVVNEAGYVTEAFGADAFSFTDKTGNNQFGLITPRSSVSGAGGSYRLNGEMYMLPYSGGNGAFYMEWHNASDVASTYMRNDSGHFTIGKLDSGTPDVRFTGFDSVTAPNGSFGSYGTNTITTAATGATNTLSVNVVIYVTAATSAALTDNAGTTEFSGVTIAGFTPIRLQPGGKFTGTSITYATGTASHAW